MTSPGPSAGCGDWAPRKLEKQRSVTFASIDLMEPIREDLPQVQPAVRERCLRWSLQFQESRV